MMESIRQVLNSRANILYSFLWTLIFSLSYSQAPIFSSNQNTYFLHGLANAGFGDLANDWFAQTIDPTPLFSFLVESIYGLIGSVSVFYYLYPLFMAIYLFSLLGIAKTVFPNTLLSKGSQNLFLAILVFLHSKLWRDALSFVLGSDWTYTFEGGWAGQRLLGEVFQPSTFGVFLLLSIYFFLIKKIPLSLVFLSLAPLFHPTFLLPAAIISFAYILLLYQENKSILITSSFALAILILMSPALFYTINNFAPSESELFQHTRRLLVEFRLPHHAIVAEWFNLSSLIQITAMGIALFLIKKSTPLLIILTAMLSLLVAGTIFLYFNPVPSLALLFPWRISIILMPLTTAIVVARTIKLLAKTQFPFTDRKKWLPTVAIIGTVIAYGLFSFANDIREKRTSPETQMMSHIASIVLPGDIFLIPIDWQDFRLITGAAIVGDFKSNPYRDTDVDFWLKRVRIASKFYREAGKKDNCNALTEIVSDYGANFVVVETLLDSDFNCLNVKPISEIEGFQLLSVSID